jgi:predicted AAA+ superfamily ATPase
METTYFAMNPWWERKDFDSGIDRPEYLERLASLVHRKQIEVIVGGRRMGKTALIEQYIKRLIQRSVSSQFFKVFVETETGPSVFFSDRMDDRVDNIHVPFVKKPDRVGQD